MSIVDNNNSANDAIIIHLKSYAKKQQERNAINRQSQSNMRLDSFVAIENDIKEAEQKKSDMLQSYAKLL